MKIRSAFLLLLLLATFFAIQSKSIFAHGDGGELRQEKDGYVIDVGYNPKETVSENTNNYDFQLSKNEEDVEFSDIWVRITSGNNTVFATGIKNQDLGGATLLYQYPKAGDYVLHVRFQKDEESIVEGEFPVKVLQENTSKIQTQSKSPLSTSQIILGIVLFLGGSLIGFITKGFIGKKK